MSIRNSLRPLAFAVAVAVLASLAGCSHLVVLHDPLSASEHNDLGVAYEARGQLELAAKQYRRSIGLDPHQSRVHVNLGNVEAARGRWIPAERCYRRALADSATDTDAMNNLAVALLKQGRRLGESRALAERAVASGGAHDSLYRATLEEVKAASR